MKIDLECPEDVKPVAKKKGETASSSSALTSPAGGK